jgi:hypothetical protein
MILENVTVVVWDEEEKNEDDCHLVHLICDALILTYHLSLR